MSKELQNWLQLKELLGPNNSNKQIKSLRQLSRYLRPIASGMPKSILKDCKIVGDREISY